MAALRRSAISCDFSAGAGDWTSCPDPSGDVVEGGWLDSACSSKSGDVKAPTDKARAEPVTISSILAKWAGRGPGSSGKKKRKQSLTAQSVHGTPSIWKKAKIVAPQEFDGSESDDWTPSSGQKKKRRKSNAVQSRKGKSALLETTRDSEESACVASSGHRQAKTRRTLPTSQPRSAPASAQKTSEFNVSPQSDGSVADWVEALDAALTLTPTPARNTEIGARHDSDLASSGCSSFHEKGENCEPISRLPPYETVGMPTAQSAERHRLRPLRVASQAA